MIFRTKFQREVLNELRHIHNHLIGIEATERIDTQRSEQIMALVQVDQTVLDEIGSELGVIAQAVTDLVNDPGNPLSDADLTSITTAVDAIQAALVEPETPVDPPVDPPVEPTE